ncbi:MAG: hypothetical protein J3Q66DRAFT_365610 [Benniella sp.]|nr:MAG: hypothetical protein J3Q66DRAFT_365610 [Benniella sp.]
MGGKTPFLDAVDGEPDWKHLLFISFWRLLCSRQIPDGGLVRGSPTDHVTRLRFTARSLLIAHLFFTSSPNVSSLVRDDRSWISVPSVTAKVHWSLDPVSTTLLLEPVGNDAPMLTWTSVVIASQSPLHFASSVSGRTEEPSVSSFVRDDRSWTAVPSVTAKVHWSRDPVSTALLPEPVSNDAAMVDLDSEVLNPQSHSTLYLLYQARRKSWASVPSVTAKVHWSRDPVSTALLLEPVGNDAAMVDLDSEVLNPHSTQPCIFSTRPDGRVSIRQDGRGVSVVATGCTLR